MATLKRILEKTLTVPHNQPEETMTVEVPLSTISQRTNSVIPSHDSKITTEYEGNVLDNDERALEIEQVNPKNSPVEKTLKNNSDHGKLTLDLDLSDVSDENSDFSSSESDSENKDEPMNGGEETCNKNKLTNLNEAGNTIYDKKKSENKSCSVEESKVEEPNKTSLLNSMDVEERSSADESPDTEDDFEENMNSMIIKFAADENDEMEQRSLSPCNSNTETSKPFISAKTNNADIHGSTSEMDSNDALVKSLEISSGDIHTNYVGKEKSITYDNGFVEKSAMTLKSLKLMKIHLTQGNLVYSLSV